MRRSGPLRRRTPLRRGGPLRARPKVLPADLREAVRLRDRSCVAAALVPDVPCWGAAHAHHVLPRGRGGPDTLANLVLLCAGHHAWVHGNPRRSRELGLLA